MNTETSFVESLPIKRIRAGEVMQVEDRLAIEEPLQIQVAYDADTGFIKKDIAVTLRTPGNDLELATGFIFSEGIIRNRKDIKSIRQPTGGNDTILITLDANARPYLKNAGRSFQATSACGICGKTSIDSIRSLPAGAYTSDNIRLPANLFYNLPAMLRDRQNLFESTGGLHAAVLFDLAGNFRMVYEDIGRHNALDKIIGASFLDDKLPLSDCILLLSGRAGFELLQKAAMAGIRVVAAIGAPSSMAVQVAEEYGISLIGFLKKDGFNIYTGQQRIINSH